MDPRISAFRSGQHGSEPLTLDQLAGVLGQPGRFVWLDLCDPSDDDLRRLEGALSLHPLSVEDALHAHQRPKIDVYDDQAFVVAYGATVGEKQRIELHELSIFVSPRFAVTVRRGPAIDTDELHRRLDHSLAAASHPGALFIYTALDQMVDAYFAAVDSLQDRIEALEEALVWSRSHGVGLDIAFDVRRDVIYFRRAVAPLREVLNVLMRRDDEIVGDDFSPYLRDLYDHVVRVYEELDTDHDLISAALEAHLSVISTDMNEIVLKVSAWAAIIALPTVIASIYGMNFDHMPELHWYYGYPFALALMGASAGSLYAYFKRKRWI